MVDNENENSNLAYARRYRPTDFEGYIGNQDVKETVTRYLKSGKYPQSYLLYGNSGCGKTTLSRVIARNYNCEDKREDGTACGTCYTCQAFDEYIKTGVADDLPDVYEIDASDNSSKKDVDAMLNSMEYPAMGGAWKIYIIDECHLLSDAAKGRLLKSLEEPPENVLIILCTTNPERLLDTIRNRCQVQLPITKPTTSEIMNLLKRVCNNESKDYDLSGLRMLVARADNVVRDSLNNLERVLNTRGDATGVSVSKEFKQVSDKLVFDFYKAYIAEDYLEYISIMYKIKTQFGFEQFLQTLTTFTIRGIYIINSVEVDGLSKEELESYLNLFSAFKPAELSIVLSELKRMSEGSIEANLMMFIYSKNKQQDITSVEAELEVQEESVSLSDERMLRNDNLSRIEKAKLDKGISSISSEMEEVSMANMSDLFVLEKVT